MRIPRGLIMSLAATLIIVGCTGDSVHKDHKDQVGQVSSAVTSTTLSVALPSGLLLGEIALYASGTLTVGDRVQVQPASGTPGALVNAGTGETNIGTDAQMTGIRSRGNVVLRDRAYVNGDVTSSGTVTVQNQVTVTGAIHGNTPITTVQKSWQLDFESACYSAIVLEPDQSLSLKPGTYAGLDVRSRSTVSLLAGIYQFDQVNLEPQARLLLDTSEGPIQIVVRSSLTHRGSIGAADGSLPRLILVYAGTASPVIEGSFSGTLLAPNASVTLASTQATYRGAFFAQNLNVQPGVLIAHGPFTDWGQVIDHSPPPPVTPIPSAKLATVAPLASAADVPAFLDWFAASTAAQEASARAAIEAVRGNSAVAQAMVDAASAAAASTNLGQAIIAFAALGHLRSAQGEQFFTGFLRQPVPADPLPPPDSGVPPETALELLETAAVDGLAYMRTASSDAEVARLIANHAWRSVRLEAARAYLFNHQFRKEDILSIVRPEERIYLDAVENRSFDGSTFEQRLANFLQAHPEVTANQPEIDQGPGECDNPL